MVIINGMKFNKITEEQVEYLKKNYQLKITDLMAHMGICDETIERMLKALGIKRQRLRKVYLPQTPEVDAELHNPYLSHVKIAKKYGVHESTVAARRREYGINVRRCMGSTLLEDKIQEYLDELDLAYIPQKKIDNWSIDFYLGNKHCIDVHGEWAHSHNSKILERDIRKIQWMENNGYCYLVIKESELDTAKMKIQAFLQGLPY